MPLVLVHALTAPKQRSNAFLSVIQGLASVALLKSAHVLSSPGESGHGHRMYLKPGYYRERLTRKQETRNLHQRDPTTGWGDKGPHIAARGFGRQGTICSRGGWYDNFCGPRDE